MSKRSRDDYGSPPLDTDLAEVCDGVRMLVKRRPHDGDRLVLLSHYPPRTRRLFPGDHDFSHETAQVPRCPASWAAP